MANVVAFEGREFRLSGRTWTAADPSDAKSDGLLGTLNEFTATLDGPGPSDGFTTLGRFLAIRVAREFRGDILELDAPPPRDGYPPEAVF